MAAATTEVLDALASLPTAFLADAVVRLGLPVRVAPAGIRGPAGARVAGPALPVRHLGSVEVFLEAFEGAAPGSVLVIDNGGRLDEACVGDLVAREAIGAGVAAIVIWGLHRDAAELAELPLPVFSYGTLPFGPTELRPAPDDRLAAARFGEAVVTTSDVVVADDGVVFLAADRIEEVAAVAATIRDTEAAQLAALDAGRSLRDQFRFGDYLRARSDDPGLTFRAHLRAIGGAVEE